MKEPISYFNDSINRNVFVVKLKKPLFDWIKLIHPDSPFSEQGKGNNI